METHEQQPESQPSRTVPPFPCPGGIYLVTCKDCRCAGEPGPDGQWRDPYTGKVLQDVISWELL